MDPNVFALGIVWYVCFLFSLTCHEAAHALVAMWGGDMTAFHGGQVTLNPIPHVRREPFGTIIVPILAFALSGWMIGWASAPYDPMWRLRHPTRAAVMALAGPAANLLIVLGAGVLIRILVGMGVFAVPDFYNFTTLVAMPDGDAVSPLGTALSILFSLNLLLAVFNLILCRRSTAARPSDSSSGTRRRIASSVSCRAGPSRFWD